jgi:hypothetical protein
MKVRVLPECRGFFDGKMRHGIGDSHKVADEFEIKPRTCLNRVDSQGKPVVLSEDEQFSAKWMEKVKPGPKAKAAE